MAIIDSTAAWLEVAGEWGAGAALALAGVTLVLLAVRLLLAALGYRPRRSRRRHSPCVQPPGRSPTP